MQTRTILWVAGAFILLCGGLRLQCHWESSSVPTKPQAPDVATPAPVEVRPTSLTPVSPTREAIPASIPKETAPASGDDALVTALRGELAQVQFELLVCQTPDAAPFGALLRLPEASTLTPEQLAVLRDTLSLYPVVLLPGEASWLAAQAVVEPGLPRPVIPDEVFVRFMGAPRVLRALGPQGLDRLRATLGEETVSRLFPGS